jgi:hypothetical protein
MILLIHLFLMDLIWSIKLLFNEPLEQEIFN